MFTDMAVNANNYIRVAGRPLEIACLLVKQLFGLSRCKNTVTLQWSLSPGGGPTPFPPQEIISCRLEEALIKECRLFPLSFRRRVIVEVTYLLKAVVTYSDTAGNIGTAVFREELSRRSRPLPVHLFAGGAARVALDLADCCIKNQTM